jgi:DNA-binding response OmpR family regulator
VPDILIASDAPWVLDEVGSVLAGPDTTLHAVRSGYDVRAAVEEIEPDLVILDLQIGNMGGFAACFDLRLEEGAQRAKHVQVLLLLDRRADVFLARRSRSDGWLLKPLDPIRLRRAVREVLAGRTYQDASYQPDPVAVPPASVTLPDNGK